MEQFTKAERKVLRRLAGIAYERELSEALSQLDSAFAEWRSGHRSPFELSDAIHQFHDRTARRLWGIYVNSHPELVVPRAVARGFLREEEFSTVVYAKVKERLGYYEQELNQEQTESSHSAG